MPGSVSYTPQGYHNVTPAIVVHDGAAAIEFYVKGLGAKERTRALGPGGKIWHAEIEVGDSVVMVADEFPEMGSKSAKTLGDSPSSLWVYVPDVDASFQRAVAAGATGVRPPEDQFWGDRMSIVEDPFGHTWMLVTHIEDVKPEDMERRRKEAEAKFRSAGNRPSPA
jgi:PhnB protein